MALTKVERLEKRIARMEIALDECYAASAQVAALRKQNALLMQQLADQNAFIAKKWKDDPTCVPATLEDAEQMIAKAKALR